VKVIYHTMKFRSLILFVLILVLTTSVALARSARKANAPQQAPRTISAKQTVTVSVCVLSGSIKVTGWDRSEVAARSDGAQIEFRSVRGQQASSPAEKIQVVVIDDGDVLRTTSSCQASSDVDLSVPHGATVQVQTRDGEVNISGVATAYAGTQNGDIYLAGISRVVEVGTVGGNVTLKESTGRIDLNSIGGNVLVRNVRPVEAADAFQITTVSGDLELQQVGHSQLGLRTVNGNLRMTGPLASGARYGINTMSGDVVLALPADASFQLHARVSANADIITDFPLTLLNEPTPPARPSPANPRSAPAQPAETPSAAVSPLLPPADAPHPKAAPDVPQGTPPPGAPKKAVKARVKVAPSIVRTYSLRRVSAICGTGDAVISLASFSGTIHLQKN